MCFTSSCYEGLVIVFNMKVSLPKDALNIICSVTEALPEYENKIFLVGGSVRDIILGYDIYDLDFVSEENVFSLTEKLCYKCFGGEPVNHYKYGNSFIECEPFSLEFTIARIEGYDENSRFPHVFPGSLEDDVLRRDFTINSLMINIYDKEFNVLDYSGRGIGDLKNKIIDTVADPYKSFHEDPLRIYRALRFAGRFDFNLAERLPEAIEANKHRITIIPKKNIAYEINKMNEKSLKMVSYFHLPKEI